MFVDCRRTTVLLHGACDHSTFDIKLTRNRLPSDLVNARSFWLQKAEFDEPKNLHAMELRLLKFVHFGEGYLGGSNFTHRGARKHQLPDLFSSVLPVVRLYVRELCLHGQHLFQNETANVSKFLASITAPDNPQKVSGR